ncbi:MAG: DNA polymerase III subunit alpha, partial [Proteobacteria bacterium]
MTQAGVPGFVHLRVHSEYSLADSIVRVKSLPGEVRERGMPAVAVTDLMNLYAMVKFYRVCVAEGVKPIVGVDLQVSDGGGASAPARVILLCRNNNGYRFLSRVLTRAYMSPRHGVNVIAGLDWFEGHGSDFVALSAGLEGELGRTILAAGVREAGLVLDRYRRIFGDGFCIEVSRIGAPREEAYIDAALDLADRHGVPALATNPVQFLEPVEFDAHDVRVCINEGRTLNDPRRVQRFTADQYLKSPAQMAEAFPGQEVLLSNTVDVARQCNVFFDFETSHMPAYPSTDGLDAEACLRRDAARGLEARLAEKTFDVAAEGQSREDYLERLDRELDVIIGMGFPGYFLIVADFIRWAKENDIPVGPGRGSGAGSLVAWSLGITDLDPLAYGLLFERFLNPERVSLPDFDIDFCMDRRDEVIEYVAQRYGTERVSQIITYGTMAARAVVRDVGRVMGHPYGYVDTLAKLVPMEIGITLQKALKDEPILKQRFEEEEEVTALIDAAGLLEGLPRNVGKHAGGVVIAPDDLSEFVPLYVEPGMTQPVTQFDKDDLEAIGLVKFDFLGLRTLTVIHNAVNMINEHRAEPLSLGDIALTDSKTFDLIKSGRTTGVFQLESRGMKEIITRLLPDRFEDLVALVALFRPGPLQSGMVDDFINRKHGREKIEYPHPSLEEILEPTYGVILYQEQVMQIAQVLSGYTLGSADLLRRAMGKKKLGEMAEQRQAFIDGARDNGVDGEIAGYIFDLVEKFAGYGFNKSHSAAYALLTYQTAWLKTHHPAEFMAASLTADMEHTDKVVTPIAETRALG